MRDMDEEGVDVQLMLPGLPPATDDVEIELAFIRANHRYTNDFCSKYPHRLKSLILISNRAIAESVQEIRKWARAPWAVGIQPNLTVGFPLDHPDLELSGPPLMTQSSAWRITASPRVILDIVIFGITRFSAVRRRTRGRR
jgi:hypothetical protein